MLLPLLLSVALLMLQHAVLCYNLLSGNYVLVQPPKQEAVPDMAGIKLCKSAFEAFILKEKPYLNPKLKITDLTLPFCTNRTYMSVFINREYGMNFSRYINSLRLKELSQMQKKPEYGALNEMELMLLAGFSSYYGYQRSKKMDEEDL